ncbi:hypothetical protein [Nostocoides sp.]|uniref:hypothetical protein n=1 Tax=Nostocoides sp. TaxID=1917966 RepID=UPI003BAEC4A4
MNNIWTYAVALIPSIGVGYLFYVIIKNLLEGDRNERTALARLDKAHEIAERLPENADSPEPDPGPGR